MLKGLSGKCWRVTITAITFTRIGYDSDSAKVVGSTSLNPLTVNECQTGPYAFSSGSQDSHLLSTLRAEFYYSRLKTTRPGLQSTRVRGDPRNQHAILAMIENVAKTVLDSGSIFPKEEPVRLFGLYFVYQVFLQHNYDRTSPSALR